MRKKIGAGAKPPREKLDPAFRRCSHCGELFFAEDVRRVENGRLCAICHERGVKLPRKQTAPGRR